MSRKKTHDEFADQLRSVNPSITLLGHYSTNKNKILCRCNVCGYEWEASPSHLLNGHGCRKCADREYAERRKWTHERFLEELSKVNDKVLILSQYCGANNDIECECAVCGSKWISKPSRLLSGRGCRKCAWSNIGKPGGGGRTALTQEEFVHRLAIANPSLQVIGEYSTIKDHIKTKCLVCGHIWNPTGNNLLAGYGCPKCSHGSTSYPEQFIYWAFVTVLGQDKVISRDTKAVGKELDIYIPFYKMAIEYGTWHWHKNRIDDDKGKQRLCAQHGIRLITIIDNCPKEFRDDNIWCYYQKLERNEPILHQLVSLLLTEIDMPQGTENLDYTYIDKMARHASRKKTTEEFKEQLYEINPNIVLLGEYENSKIKTEFKCTVCGNTWSATPNNILHGYGCPECKNEKTRKRRSKRVRCIETGLVYESIQLASEATGCSKTGIAACCRGAQNSSGGVHWETYD